VELDGVAELVCQHAGDLIGRARPLHEAARQDDLAARHREGIDQRPVEQHHPHLHGTARCRGEAPGEPIERGSARRRLADLVILGDAGDEIPPEHLARVLRHEPGHGLRRVQLEEPEAHGNGHNRSHRRQAGPQTAPALARGGESGRPAQELAGEGGVGHEQRLGAPRLQAQQHVGSLGVERNVAAQLGVGPQPHRQARHRADLQARAAQAHHHGCGAGRAAVAERAREAHVVRTRRH
jgi:hypothetical protein